MLTFPIQTTLINFGHGAGSSLPERFYMLWRIWFNSFSTIYTPYIIIHWNDPRYNW